MLRTAKLREKNEQLKKLRLLHQEKERLQYRRLKHLSYDLKEKNRQYKGVVEIVKDEEVKLNRLRCGTRKPT